MSFYANAPQRRAIRRFATKTWSAAKAYGQPAAVAAGAYLKKKLGAKPMKKKAGRPIGPFKPKFSKKSVLGRKYTADPTNKVSTSSSGGMTTHSMTVNMGSKKNLMQKLVKSSKESFTHRFGAIQPFNNTLANSINFGALFSGGGAYCLANYNTLVAGATGAFSQFMPVHTYDLTCVTNINTGTVVAGTPLRELNFQGVCTVAGILPTNRVDFNTHSGRTSDGVTLSTTWNVEKSTKLAVSSVPLGMIMQEWTQIKMLCYGAKIYSTRFKVQVVQIVEDDFHPLEVASIDQTINTAPQAWDDVSAPVNFWQGVSSSSYKHPIATVSTDYKKNIRVIKEFNFIIDPTTTIEERAEVGHTKALNIFIPMYRTNNYNSKAQAVDGSLADADNFGTDFEKNEAYLKPRARIYLIVQATNPYTHFASGDPMTPANTPSYDIVIRSKFSQLS